MKDGLEVDVCTHNGIVCGISTKERLIEGLIIRCHLLFFIFQILIAKISEFCIFILVLIIYTYMKLLLCIYYNFSN